MCLGARLYKLKHKEFEVFTKNRFGDNKNKQVKFGKNILHSVGDGKSKFI